jgi:hypothetical protein
MGETRRKERMRRLTSKKALAATAAVLAVGGGAGAAIAASQGNSASPSAFFDAVAKHLGISSDELRDATKAAAIDQVNAALEDGRITKAQADELKARIESGDFPLFFGPGFPGGFHGHLHGPGEHLSAAASYLGLTEDQLIERLNDGRSLADLARAEDKSVDGLKQAIVDEAKKDLDEAVADGDLTQDEADAILERLRARIDDFVNGTVRVWRGHHRLGPGPGLFRGADEELRWETWRGRPFA